MKQKCFISASENYTFRVASMQIMHWSLTNNFSHSHSLKFAMNVDLLASRFILTALLEYGVVVLSLQYLYLSYTAFVLSKHIQFKHTVVHYAHVSFCS